MNLRGKDFLTLLDFNKEELEYILSLAFDLKRHPRRILRGKTLLLLFEKPSTRTRVSFEVAMYQLGGHSVYLDFKTTQLSRGETVEDTGKVLSRYGDGIMARMYNHNDLERLAKAASIPVINGLTDKFHPCQTLGDIMTVIEKKGKVDGLKVVFMGDCAFNMANSTMIGFSKMGADVFLVCPKDKRYMPDKDLLKRVNEEGRVFVVHDPVEGVSNADVIYTDVWVSMGQEDEREERLRDLRPYQVNGELVRNASKDFIFMHCLPAKRGEEVTDEIIDGVHSVVWDQAENRLHVQKGILAALLCG